jgi:hypothetical protein
MGDLNSILTEFHKLQENDKFTDVQVDVDFVTGEGYCLRALPVRREFDHGSPIYSYGFKSVLAGKCIMILPCSRKSAKRSAEALTIADAKKHDMINDVLSYVGLSLAAEELDGSANEDTSDIASD